MSQESVDFEEEAAEMMEGGRKRGRLSVPLAARGAGLKPVL